MPKKGFKDLLAEANAVVDVIAVHDAVNRHITGDVVFVDVRESDERAKGTIPQSIHAPRGFLEFIADPAGPMHNPAFASDQKLVLFCHSPALTCARCSSSSGPARGARSRAPRR